MKKRSYWTVLNENILTSKKLVLCVLFTAILCFGFPITNFSIGVDDSAGNYYLYGSAQGTMIQQGRLLHVLLSRLTGAIEFLPFFTDFCGAVLFSASALLYCGFFLYMTDGKLSNASLISFACLYISNSILVEKFIYHLDVIPTMLSYCFSPLALVYGYRFVKEKKASLFVKTVAALIPALASYESFATLYFCGVFAIFLLEILVNGEKKSFASIILEGLRYAAALIAAMAVYYSLVHLVQILTHQDGIFIRYNYWAESDRGLVGTFLHLTEKFVRMLRDFASAGYLPVRLFLAFSLLGAAVSLFWTVRRKNVWVMFCFVCLWLGNFLIHYVSGNIMTRTSQTFCFFGGFVAILLLEAVEPKLLLKILVSCVMALLVFVQSADMTRWFYNDYARYQKETFVIDSVAAALAGEYDLSKSVVFAGTRDTGYLDTAVYPGRQVNGNAMTYWSIDAWGDKTQPFVKEIFRMHGYDFLLSPTPDQYDAAQEEAKAMPAWPNAGYIRECEDFIVVNFG